MTSHDACTSKTSRILTLASLQRLNMEALIPAPADCEVWSVIKFLNAQSTAPIEIHHTGLVFEEFRVQIPSQTKVIGVLFAVSIRRQYKCCVAFTLPRNFYPLFQNSYIINIKRVEICKRTLNTRRVRHSGSNPRRQISTTQGYKIWSHGMTNVSILEMNMLKIAQHLLYLFQ